MNPSNLISSLAEDDEKKIEKRVTQASQKKVDEKWEVHLDSCLYKKMYVRWDLYVLYYFITV